MCFWRNCVSILSLSLPQKKEKKEKKDRLALSQLNEKPNIKSTRLVLAIIFAVFALMFALFMIGILWATCKSLCQQYNFNKLVVQLMSCQNGFPICKFPIRKHKFICIVFGCCFCCVCFFFNFRSFSHSLHHSEYYCFFCFSIFYELQPWLWNVEREKCRHQAHLDL